MTVVQCTHASKAVIDNPPGERYDAVGQEPRQSCTKIVGLTSISDMGRKGEKRSWLTLPIISITPDPFG